jgi:hypothetical protein
MSRSWPILLLLLTTALIPAGAAQAATPFSFVGEAVRWTLQTDARYAAFETSDGNLRLIDTRTGGVSTYAPPRADCRFVDVGGGKLLWSCGELPRLHVVTLKIRTGQIKERDVPFGEMGGAVAEVGTYWFKAYGGDHRGGSHTSWWSLATDEYRVDSAGEGYDARGVDDLDVPGLVRRLCSPLHRRPNPGYDGELDNEEYNRYQYDRRFGLTFDEDGWLLDRCGSPVSSRLPRKISDPRLVAGRVTWTKGSKLVAHDARSRRSFSWRRTEIDPAATGARIHATRRTLFVATARGDAATRERVYSAPFPR